MSDRTNGGVVGAAVFLLALLGSLLWLSLLSGPWRLASGMLEAQEHLNKAQKALTRGALKEARYRTLAGRAAAERADDGLRLGGPVFDLVRVVPRGAGALDQMPHLVAAARHSAQAAVGSLDVAQNALRGPNKIIAKDPEDPEGGARVRLERVREVSDTVAAIRDDIAAVRRELGAVDPAKLPRRVRPQIGTGIARAEETLKLLADARAGLEILPTFLGAEEPRTYLIGMQNSAEQRGTGGAILQFALLSIADGRPDLVRDRSGTVYKVDIDRQQRSIALPDDAWYVRGIPDAQRFGNANWSPDWPLSARLTARYGQASDAPFPDEIDGVIAVDPVTMQELMPGIGPFKVKAGHRLTARSVVHFTLYKAYASYPIPGIRRDVLRQVVDAFFERILRPAHPTAFVKGMGDSLSRKHVQIWLTDAREQEFVERMNWDGAIERAEDRDYLYVVEQNVGGNKLDYFDENTTNVRIQVDGNDTVATTRARVINRVFLPQPRWSMGDSGPMHRPMLNVYVPRRAQLLDASVDGTRIDVPPQAPLATWVDGRPPEHFERGKRVWSATLLIAPTEDAAVRYRYRVPGAIRTIGGRKVYRLIVQRQPRVRPETLSIRFELPKGARAVRAPGFVRDGDELVLQRPLRKDVELEVSWQG